MVGLLELAAGEACEGELGACWTALLEAGELPDLDGLRDQVPAAAGRPACAIEVPLPPIAAYDACSPAEVDAVTAARQAEAARLPLMLAELRLPTVARLWPEFAERADKEGWPAARFLAALVEHELAERVTRRIERHRLESGCRPSKTLATFDFAAVPTRLARPTSWRWPPATPGSRRAPTSWSSGRPAPASRHLGSALGHALVDNGYRVLFSRTSDLVQRLQAARRDLAAAEARWPSSTASTCSSSTTSATSGRTRPRPACCSS